MPPPSSSSGWHRCRLAHDLAAVDVHGRTGDEVGLIGHQEKDTARHILNSPKASCRNLIADEVVDPLRRRRTHHVRVDVSRCHGVDGDAARHALPGQRLGEGNDGALGGTVGGFPEIRAKADSEAMLTMRPKPALRIGVMT